MLRTFLIVLSVLFICKNSNAQFDTGGLNSNIVIQDSISENDTTINRNGFFSLFTGKPGKAALYSLILPSGGQIYNRKWWKVPIALGIDGGLIYSVHWNNKKYKETQALYLEAIATSSANKGQIKLLRDYYQKYSEYSWVWLIAGHLLTVVDAFVDRHLMEFDISDDLTFRPDSNILLPTIAQVKFKISLNEKVNKKVNPNYPSLP